MITRDKLAVIAHDGRKADLVAWATYNRDRLSGFDIQTVMRVCNVHSVAIATNVAAADLFLASPLLHTARVERYA